MVRIFRDGVEFFLFFVRGGGGGGEVLTFTFVVFVDFLCCFCKKVFTNTSKLGVRPIGWVDLIFNLYKAALYTYITFTKNRRAGLFS